MPYLRSGATEAGSTETVLPRARARPIAVTAAERVLGSHLDERRRSVGAQDPQASALEVARVPSGTAAELEHGAVTDQPGYHVEVGQDGWAGGHRLLQVHVRGLVVRVQRDVPGCAGGRRADGHGLTVGRAAVCGVRSPIAYWVR